MVKENGMRKPVHKIDIRHHHISRKTSINGHRTSQGTPIRAAQHHQHISCSQDLNQIVAPSNNHQTLIGT